MILSAQQPDIQHASRAEGNKAGRERVVHIEHLKKSFGERAVLNDINLDVYQNENLVILGRSGTGKSVLIKCMVGLIPFDSGVINVLGYDVGHLNLKTLNELRLQVGFSFQGSALYDSMTVRENLEFPLKRNLGMTDTKKLRDMVGKALEDVGLAGAAEQLPAELSGVEEAHRYSPYTDSETEDHAL